MKIILHDSLSSLRLRLEQRSEPPLMMLRGVINEALMPDRLTIWCWDGKGANDPRRELLPGYKDRPITRPDIYHSLNMIRELLTTTGAWQACLPGYEADDLIAAFVQQFDGNPIEIMTRDGDLTALCGPTVTCRAPAKAPADLIRLYKLTVGDPSDNIPGISGFGEGSWNRADKQTLAVLMTKVLRKEPWTDEFAETVMSRRATRWLRENEDLVRRMKQVIDPRPLTLDQLNASLTKGVNDPVKREALMKRYLL